MVPAHPAAEDEYDFERLSVPELRALEALLEKAKRGPSASLMVPPREPALAAAAVVDCAPAAGSALPPAPGTGTAATAPPHAEAGPDAEEAEDEVQKRIRPEALPRTWGPYRP